MKTYALVIPILLALTGCMSTPRYQVNMSASELSHSIESTSSSTVAVRARPTYQSADVNVNVGATYFSESSSSRHTYNSYDADGGFANNRIAIARRSTLNVGVNNYNVYGGYEISFTGGDDNYQFRLALHGNRADFQTNGTNGFSDPFLFGVDIDVHKLLLQHNMDYLVGIRLTSAQLGYGLDKPVEFFDETYTTDSLGVFGIGVPIGVQMDVGSLTLEAIATPTVYFHGLKTYLGFGNDITNTNFNIPISAGLGFNW